MPRRRRVVTFWGTQKARKSFTFQPPGGAAKPKKVKKLPPPLKNLPGGQKHKIEDFLS